MGKCRVCNKEVQGIISFGKMPIANNFLNRVTDKEFFYNLSVVFCPNCFMAQLGKTVRPDALFNDNYQFISSTSSLMTEHFRQIAEEITQMVSSKQKPFIVELGCNDGIMLRHIASRGIDHLGVEPSGNVAQLARKNGIEVLEKFFNEDTAAEIVKKQGQADVICGANVFCHIEDINSVFRGINVLLKNDGVLFFEEPYLLDIMRKSSFDQIYDEHVYYFSGMAISGLAQKHKMRLVDMVHQDVHGGSMRYYVKKGDSSITGDGVSRFLREEKDMDLDKIEGYLNFKNDVDKVCSDLKQVLRKIRDEGKPIVGYGATSKSTTLLNYARIGPELINYICDTTPNKINKFSPGMHIPIRSHDSFRADKPLYALLLAWNHKKEIFEKEKGHRASGGKFITYFPKVTVE